MTNATTCRTTASSRRIRRCPSPSVVVIRAPSQLSTSCTAEACFAERSSTVVDHQQLRTIDLACDAYEVDVVDGQADEVVRPTLELLSNPGPEAQPCLEHGKVIADADHRRDQGESLGAQPSIAEGQPGRETAHRVGDDCVCRAVHRGNGIECVPHLDRVALPGDRAGV